MEDDSVEEVSRSPQQQNFSGIQEATLSRGARTNSASQLISTGTMSRSVAKSFILPGNVRKELRLVGSAAVQTGAQSTTLPNYTVREHVYTIPPNAQLHIPPFFSPGGARWVPESATTPKVFCADTMNEHFNMREEVGDRSRGTSETDASTTANNTSTNNYNARSTTRSQTRQNNFANSCESGNILEVLQRVSCCLGMRVKSYA